MIELNEQTENNLNRMEKQKYNNSRQTSQRILQTTRELPMLWKIDDAIRYVHPTYYPIMYILVFV
jgi:hypothetical protein